MINGLNHITMAVSELDTSLRFYQKLGFVPEVKWNTGAYLSQGDIWLCLSLGKVLPGADYTNICFSINAETYKKFECFLKQENVKQWKANSSEGDSLYFNDPDGHKLEVHVGTLESRLQSLRQSPYSGLEWLNSKPSS